MYDDNERPARNRHDRRVISEGIELDRIEAGIDRIGSGNHREGIAIGRRPDAGFITYGAAAAGAVFDDDLLAEDLGEAVRHEPRDEITTAARRRCDDNANGLR